MIKCFDPDSGSKWFDPDSGSMKCNDQILGQSVLTMRSGLSKMTRNPGHLNWPGIRVIWIDLESGSKHFDPKSGSKNWTIKRTRHVPTWIPGQRNVMTRTCTHTYYYCYMEPFEHQVQICQRVMSTRVWSLYGILDALWYNLRPFRDPMPKNQNNKPSKHEQ